MIFATLIACVITTTASITGPSPQSANPPATQNKASADEPPVKIISSKIVPKNYPMLDQESAIAPPIAPENEAQPGGRPRIRPMRGPHSEDPLLPPQKIRAGDLFQVVIKNASAKSIKVVEWDFQSSHCENGQFIPRYDVTTRVNLKPGGKKTLKSKLPVLDRCAMPEGASGEIRKQEEVSIKRIEYVDGSVW